MKDRSYEKRMIIICIILGIILVILAIYNKGQVKQEGAIIEYTVKQGDNLTSIANKYSDEYVLKTIAKIKKDNGLVESDLKIGQVLRIEVK